MIIVRLSGGLGNQLFQYALARALKERGGETVKLDASFLATDQAGLTKRQLGLDKFKIGLDFVEEPSFSFWQRLRSKILPLPFKTIIHDTGFAFDQRILKLKGNKYLLGNWLSPKYFSHIRQILLDELQFKNSLSDEARSFLGQIESSCSVSLHVRRGDYLKYPKLGLCSLEYYQAAIDYVKSQVVNPTFFVFSDDIDYVKQSFGLGEHTIYVKASGLTDEEEFVLMSKCQHNITANSSFSWWAAWLNQNPNKIVVVPKDWRADGKSTSDYVPEDLGWVRL